MKYFSCKYFVGIDTCGLNNLSNFADGFMSPLNKASAVDIFADFLVIQSQIPLLDLAISVLNFNNIIVI